MTASTTAPCDQDMRLVLCDECGSEGRRYTMNGNDPDSEVDRGPCSNCEGTGRALVEAEPVTLDDLEGDEAESDYLKFRGKCKEMSEALISADPTLTLVRGHYHCPIWGEQPHWWCKKPDGTIVDPTKTQFPSRGCGIYVEFDGVVECSNCGKRMKEDEAEYESNYCFCSYRCHGQFVGAF